MEKKLDGIYPRMLRAILNKSWRQHLTKQQLYAHLSSITKTIKIRRNRHAGHCWRSRDELISDVLLWTPSHGRAKAERPARTCIQQLCADTECSYEDLPEAMDNRELWWERGRNILADSVTWWWWWWWSPLCCLLWATYTSELDKMHPFGPSIRSINYHSRFICENNLRKSHFHVFLGPILALWNTCFIKMSLQVPIHKVFNTFCLFWLPKFQPFRISEC